MARNTGKLGPEFTYDLTALKKVDPALVHYAESGAIAAGMETPRAVALGPDGRLLVAGDERIGAFEDGKAAGGFAVGGPPHCLAAGPDGTVYVGLKDRVEVYGADGNRRAAWNPLGDRSYTTGLAVGETDVFVADAGGRVLWRFDPEGKVLARIGEKNEEKHAEGLLIPSPYCDVALGPEGMLWLTNPGRRRVENYTYDGSYRFAWGKASMRIEGFCGCCNPTHLAIGPDGRFFTSEKGLPRVKRYDPQGDFECVVAPPKAFADGTTGLDLAVDSAGRVLVLDPHRRAVRIFEPKKD
jgi:streptogramin lyase